MESGVRFPQTEKREWRRVFLGKKNQRMQKVQDHPSGCLGKGCCQETLPGYGILKNYGAGDGTSDLESEQYWVQVPARSLTNRMAEVG